jgi:hypothetical protein
MILQKIQVAAIVYLLLDLVCCEFRERGEQEDDEE